MGDFILGHRLRSAQRALREQWPVFDPVGLSELGEAAVQWLLDIKNVSELKAQLRRKMSEVAMVGIYGASGEEF